MTLQVTPGFHHVTLVAADVRRTLRFYTRMLGLRLLKQSPPYSDRGAYQLYLSVGTASPRAQLTFFEWPGSQRGQWGVGGVHHVALGVATPEVQLKWKRWLTDRHIGVAGPFNRGYFSSIYFRDPDGHILEIATSGPGYGVDEPMDALGQNDVIPPGAELRGNRDEAAIAARTWPELVNAVTPDMALTGIHHVSTVTDDLPRLNDFLGDTLGLSLIKRTFNQDARDTRHWFWASYDGQTVAPYSALTAFGWPGSTLRARSGVGQAHHIAFRAGDEQEQLAWRDHLLSLGVGVSPVVDRNHFTSVYFSAPDGLLIELATDGTECEGSLASSGESRRARVAGRES